MCKRILSVVALLLALGGGSVSAEILFYDDGFPAWVWPFDTLLYYAVRFTPPNPCSVVAGQIWPQAPMLPGYQCTLFVWDDAGGLPGALLYDTLLNTFPLGYLDTFFVSPYWTGTSDFWVGYSTQNVPGVGRCWGQSDANLDYPDRNYVSFDRTFWGRCIDEIPMYDGDLLIRAMVVYPQFTHDVGAQSINVADTLPCDTTISPAATVCNWGDSVETFRVDATIDSAGNQIYSDFDTVFALGVGACTSVTFGPWTVPHADGFCYDFTVWTGLPGDDSTYNDTLTKQVCAVCPAIHDVMVDSIVVPDTVPCDTIITPAARVCNYGDTVETFEVWAEIDSAGATVYSEVDTATALLPDSCTLVSFPNWTVPHTDGFCYDITVWTDLPGDTNPGNDTLSKQVCAVCAAIHDVGVDSVVQPPDTVGCGSTVPVAAWVCNYGDTLETFDVAAVIDSGGLPLAYADTQTVVSLVPDPDSCRLVNFVNWTVPTTHGVSYTVTVTTLLAGDSNPANDTATSVTVGWCPPGHDVGADTVFAPPDTVACDSMVLVAARVCNYGDTAETFDVEAIIVDSGGVEVYGDTFTVADLDTNACDTVTFDIWTVPPDHGVLYTVTIATLLLDANPANDTVSKTTLSWCPANRDVGVHAVLQPPDTVACETMVLVAARVHNYGDSVETFDVEALIDSGGPPPAYSDTQTVTGLSPGVYDTVTFATWVVPNAHAMPYTVTVTTLLGWDINPANDTAWKPTVGWCPPGVEEVFTLPVSPSLYGLGQSRPNPAKGQVSIDYQLPAKSRVFLRVYDLTGTVVRTLVEAVQETGFRTATWDGRDDRGQPVASGIYFYNLEVVADGGVDAERLTAVRKVVLLR